MPKVSIIVPAYNEEKRIEKCLESLCNQSFKDLEIIVVDDFSQDHTVDIVRNFMKKHDNVKLIFAEGGHRGPGNAKNTGVKASTGEVIIFKDAHTIVTDENFVQNLVQPFEDPEIDVVLASEYKLKPTSSFLEDCLIIRHYGARLGSKGRFPEAFRKRIIKKVGGFDPQLGFGDDTDLVKRIFAIDCKKAYTTNPVQVGAEVKTFRELINRCLWYGRTLPDYWRKNKDDMPKIVAPFLYFFCITGIFFTFLFSWFLIPYLCILLLVFTFQCVKALKAYLKTKHGKACLSIPILTFVQGFLIFLGLISRVFHKR